MSKTTILTRVKPWLKPLIGAGIAAACVAAAALTAESWLPPLWQRIARLTAAPREQHGSPNSRAGEHGADDHLQDLNALEVSRAAQRSQGIDVAPLVRSDYERTMPVPGLVVPILGVTYHDVATKASGEITRIHALEGQIVQAGAPLFEMSLTHAEAIQHQMELIDALAQLEVAKAEIARYEQLDRTNPGGLPGAKLRERRYEMQHLHHTIDSRRQMLALLGLPTAEVDALIERHRQAHATAGATAAETDKSEPLIDSLTVYAPSGESPSQSKPLFVVENLSVRLGEHVEVGAALCRLGDYRRLYVEGQAFERDLEAVRRAMTEQWGVTVAVEQAAPAQPGGVTLTEQDLPIVYIDSAIDAESRSARFYVELTNTLQTPLESMRRPFADWRFRVGQRIELRVPTQRFDKKLVIPAEAVAEDGLERYVFQVSGDTFIRRRVEIAWRDESKVVLAERQSIDEGVRIAMSGAYQLQLSLQNRAAGPVEHTHHH